MLRLLFDLLKMVRRQREATGEIEERQWLSMSFNADEMTRCRALLCVLDDTTPHRRVYQSKRVAHRIAQMLADPSERVRRYAMLALSHVREPSSIPSLVRILETEGPEPDRFLAAHALGYQGGQQAVMALRAIAQDERQPVGLREECLRALGEAKDADGLLQLLPSLQSAEPWPIRWALAQGLRQAGLPEAKEVLERLCSDKRVPRDLRNRAKWWLEAEGNC